MKKWWCCRVEDDGVPLLADTYVLAATARMAGQDIVEDLGRRGLLAHNVVVTVRVGPEGGPLTDSFLFRLRFHADEVSEVQREGVAEAGR